MTFVKIIFIIIQFLSRGIGYKGIGNKGTKRPIPLYLYILIPYILISLFPLNCFAQTKNEQQMVRHLMDNTDKKPDYSFAKANTNELQMLFSGLFLVYKSFISSQDAVSCTFIPSCSEYGMQSIKKLGMARGLMNTFDRLTRCNGLSPEKYSIDPKTHLLLDPLWDWLLV